VKPAHPGTAASDYPSLVANARPRRPDTATAIAQAVSGMGGKQIFIAPVGRLAKLLPVDPEIGGSMRQFTLRYGKLVLAALLVSIATACTSPLEPKTADDEVDCFIKNGTWVCR
jgi:hypothetical protein